jgi:hypothetical protein
MNNIKKLSINRYKGDWESTVVASIIPDGSFSNNPYKVLFDGKTKEERAEALADQFNTGITDSPKSAGFNFEDTTDPGVNYTTWVDTYYGVDFSDSGLVASYDAMFEKIRKHYNTAFLTKLYNPWINNTGIPLPGIEAVIEDNKSAKATAPALKAEPIQTKSSGGGYRLPGSPPPKSSTGTYDIGTSKN